MNQIVTETLYRKYRPQSFSDVIGQSEVVETLEKQISSGAIAHAYLFSGGRGTGKTSIARIFARELGTDETDIYEIDAASNRGINEIRELRDGVSNLPFSSQYKVYIIDEVHMLTKEAFNALLKTLEEPPQHVIFILATTEKHKVLDTILSRCQVYDFKLAIRDSLIELINHVAKEEKRSIDDESAQFVANLGNGSFRDTLSHLQKIFAVTDKKITIDQVEQIAGQSNNDLENQLLQAISDKDQESVFATYQSLVEAKADTRQLIESLLDKIRSVLMLRYSKDYQASAGDTMTQEQLDLFTNLSGITSHTLRELLNVYELSLKSSRPGDCFEVFLFEQFEKEAK